MENVSDIYSLSPMQQGMLFHTLYDPASGAYSVQTLFTVKGALDEAAFRRTWERIVERHPILRTAFVWEGVEEPLQVVYTQVDLPFAEHDLRAISPEAQEEQVQQHLLAERARGFHLTDPPLMRFVLLRLAEQEYRLIWSIHHILVDGWSLPLLMNEFQAFYEAFRRGEDIYLPEPLPYGEYVGWLQEQDLAEVEAFWRRTLAGFSAPTSLGITRGAGAPAGQPEDYTEQAAELDASLTTRLTALAQQHGVTLNTVLQAAWGLLLAKYSGEEDVLFGAVVSGRSAPIPGIEAMVGPFINTLPVRMTVQGEERLLDWWKRLQEQQFEARSYEFSPLVQVQTWSAVPRGTSLFDSLFVFENYPGGEAEESHSLLLEPIHAVEQTNYPITVLAAPGDTLHLRVLYDRRQVDDEAVARLLGHFGVVLRAFADRPDQPVNAICLLTPAEAQQMLITWNETATNYGRDRTIHSLFEEQAARTPDAPAVLSAAGEVQLTYADLNARANQLAHALRKHGAGDGSLVAICAERGPDLFVGLLAILKAGAAYVPLDRDYPADRLAYMLEDAQSPVLITQSHLRENLPATGARVICLDTDWAAIATEPATNPEPASTAESLAYVIYTSGSTGRPKGTAVPHRGVVRLVIETDYVQLGPNDRIAQASNVSFDAATFELWGALLKGGRLVVIPKDLALSPRAYAETIRTQGITTLFITTALFNQMAREVPHAFGGARYVLFGGEACDPNLVRRVLEHGGPEKLLHVYGPTESTTFTTWHEVTAVPEGARTIPIGRPLANTTLYVLDRSLLPVPVGAPGELYIGGDGLAREYLNQPGLTADRFVDSPWGRLYKSGDIVRYLPEGAIEFVGRADNQVKIRGFRIELGEIEAVLGQHPLVQVAAVIAREDQPGSKRLVAYVVPAEGAAVDAGALRAYLAERLPEYMVPAAFVAMESLPINPNGKVDRRALPAPDLADMESADSYVAPRTPTEEVLASIFAQVLGYGRVSTADNFFALGGHSLLATQAISRIREVFAVEVPVRTLFEAPTVQSLAPVVDGYLNDGSKAEAPPFERVSRAEALPLSFAQQRLWFIEQMQPGTATYNMPMALRLTGSLDTAALAQAFTALVCRHEALRTTFAMAGAEPVQVIAPAAEFPLPVIDLSDLPAVQREAEVYRLASDEAARPFDLTAGPLLRAGLLRLSDSEHVLLVTMHHIVSDGWSMGVLLGEISALYAGQELPALPIQYADFAVWQRRWLQGAVLEGQLAYWREALAGAPSLLELPTDRPRPPVQTFAGADEHFELPADVLEGLKALSRQEGATLFMTLLAAFKVLLHRYARQEDIAVGTPIANRNRVETEGLIGFFVNTLVMRTDLSGSPSFRELLSRVRSAALGAYAHQDVPFEQVVEAVRPDRNLSHSPLFQVLFALQNADTGSLELPGLQAEYLATEHTTARVDMTLSLEEGEEGLFGSLEYNTDLFDRTTVQRFIGHFRTLLEAIVADADQPVGSLAMLSPGEAEQVLVDWNQTATPYPAYSSIPAIFAEQAALTPDAVAVVHGDRALTYAELNRRANRLAHRLRALGVGPEAMVGLCAERSPELIVALLAILKAGGAYVPLDPSYPQERLAFMLADASVSVLLTQPDLAAKLPAHGAQVLDLTADFAAESEANPVSYAGPESLAYVIYTSGSTGTPKGVAVPHRAVVRLVKATNYASFGPGEVFLQFATMSFDAATFEIWGALLSGAKLVLMPVKQASVAELGQVIQQYGVTTLWLTAGLFHQMIESGPELFRGVRQLLAGGDVLSPAHVVRALRELPGCTVINGYGPTENTTFTCCHPMTAETVLTGSVPIGRPIANTTVYVLDGEMQPVPVGVPGELCTGGDGLARGYLNRPELTEEKFIDSPYGRLYRTGDLVRWLPDGTLEFMGRIDQQVKIRGFRIELGEIEAVLAGHPAASEVIVIARGEGAADKRLVAYVVPGSSIDAADLRTYLKERLPEYMVPAAVVLMGSLPLTANGKVDRRALPEPDLAAASADFVAPRTPAEEILAAIWAQLLGLPRVSVQANFFDLGGHSLLATQVLSRIREAFGVEVSVRAFFEAPTVAELAARVAAGRSGAPAPAITAQPDRTGLPLSFAQQRLWFIDQMEPGAITYNMPLALRLTGTLDLPALERAIGGLITRHETLRTSFSPEQVQVIAPAPGTFTLPVTVAASEEEAQRLAAEEAATPFDLAAGPLFRASLLKLSETEHILLLTMHHILSDGWSISILMSELSALYLGQELASLPIQYGDFARWQREWLSGEVLEAQLGYWRQQLAGAPALLELPTDRPRPAVQSFHGAARSRTLSPALRHALNELARREGVTLFMALLAAFQTLLARYAGQEDITVGSPIAGRNRAETEGLIGFFVNTLVLRTDLSGAPTFREVLRRVREVTLGAYAHQDLPFEQVVDALQPQRDLSHTPLFQVMFALQNTPAGDLALPGLTIANLGVENEISPFDLVLNVYEGEQGLDCELRYATALFDATTIDRMLGHLETLLTAVAADAALPVAELPLLTAPEREQLLTAWNQTALDYPQAVCFHRLFEQQARLHPDFEAVRFGEERLTYGELNRRANQLAHHLRSLGVGPDVLVGLSVNRSPEMIVGLLGILKAGGAYVPMDPTYPQDRIAYMLEDSQVPVLLTQQALVAGLPRHGARTICLDADWPVIAAQPDTNPTSGVTPENLAYVIYTSGSTGRPKGVLVEHRGLTNLTEAQLQTFGHGPRSRILQFASLSFDASIFEIAMALRVGARLYLAPREALLPGPSLIQILHEQAITMVTLSPSVLAAMPDADLPALQTIITAGEACTPEIAERWGRGRLLYNAYGPTEATVWASGAPITPSTRPHIGRPVANKTLYVLDRNLQPVPVGVPGELCIGGVGLARGYLNRPALTADKFVETSFGRIYRTGDLVRYLPDGNIEFLGRVDRQVKLRGFRIELGEIESALTLHPALREAVVILREEDGVKRLVAYVVPAGAERPEAADLRAFLKEQLPEYMVPAAYVAMDAFPLTANGKVDLRALPAPDRSGSALAGAYVAPRTPAEEALARGWAQVLGLDRVSVTDNFFALGGDSILSLQIISRAARAGLTLTAKQLFQYQTVAEQAAVAGAAPAVQAEQGPVVGELPLTPIQTWFFERNLPEQHHWNQDFLLEAPFDPNGLEQAISQLVAHHDSLRTRFHQSETGAWVQEVPAGEAAPCFTTVDIAGEPDLEAAIERVTAAAQASLDLTRGPLLRATLIRLGPDRSARLHLAIHHLAMDGVSWRILLEDLAMAYEQVRNGEPVRLPAKTTSFKRWAHELQDYARGEALARQLPYWLAPERSNVAALPVDFHETAVHTNAASRTVSVSLSAAETTALLQEVHQAYRTQVNDLLLAALAEAVSGWTGSRTVLVDMEGHGREEILEGVDLSRTVGWFTTLYPVLLDLSQATTPGAALQAVKAQLRAVPDRGIGYGLLRYLSADAQAAQQLATQPKAGILFNYLGQFDQVAGGGDDATLRLANEATGPAQSPAGTQPHLLAVNTVVAGGQLRVDLTYSDQIHTEATVTGLAQAYITALRNLIGHCKALLAQVAERLGRTDLADLYPLSPMQEGMLFHTLYAPDSGIYTVQTSFTYQGALNRPLFEATCKRIFERHSILRTGFVWEGVPTPLQAVFREVALPLAFHDLRHMDEAVQQAYLTEFQEADRRQGFALTEAPLTRITLFQLGEERFQFVWSIHHMLMDGWCVPLIMNEVFAIYEALAAGHEPVLEPARPYGDYIAWLGKQDLAAAERFWRERLNGFITPTPLGIDRGSGSPATQVRGYGEQVLALPGGLTGALQRVAQQHKVTLNTVLQGAWGLLLSRYSGEEDVLFGATVSGRSADLPGVDRIMGPLINTLPVRVSLPPAEFLFAALQRLQEQQAEARQFEYSPLLQVQGWSQVSRGTALFESLLVFENAAIYAPAEEGESGSELELTHYADHTNYPITIVVLPGRELSLKVSYDRSRVDDDAVGRMLGHLVRVLHSMAAYPEQRVGEVRILTEAERNQMARWNETAASYPQDRCVHTLVDAQAAATPDAIAIEAPGEALNYGELNRRANRLARRLRTLGVRRGALVGILADSSPAMVVGQLAVLKAGGAYVPIDPAYPQGRIAFLLEDACVTVLLTRQHLLDRAPKEHGVTVVNLDQPVDEDDADLPSRMAVSDPAYVIYTSGSTGKPKGVVVSHGSLLNLLFWHRSTYGVTSADRASLLAGPAFDASVWELWPYLTAGATLCVPDANTRLSPDDLAVWLVQQGITLSFVPTPLAEELLAREWPAQVPLRAMFTGGDRLHHYPTARIPFALINHYGPTESTVVATAGAVPALEGADRAPSIGRPIANTQVYLLDKHLRQVPIGVPGELHITGDGLALGYLRRPELTVRKFIPNPFSSDPLLPLYKTGDLARWLPDGTLEFVGRSDNQVKIRGYRVELGEIEAVLLQHPAVREAVVLARTDSPGEQRLVAYIVPVDEEPAAADLRTFLGERLPAYMIPVAYVCQERLPLMPNGKVDRRVLPVPARLLLDLTPAHEAPRDWLELQLALVWEEVLGVAPVGVTDNFFALGGHSLMALRLVTRMQEVLGVPVTVSTLLHGPTVAQVAAALRQEGEGAPSLLVPIQPEGSRPPLFFVHPAGGGVACYQPLAGALGPDQPFYGLQSPGLAGEPCDEVEVLASRYIEAIRTVQPAGPYQLGGWSFGGLVAYEMARQLSEAGEEVAPVVLVDTHLTAPASVQTEAASDEGDLFGQVLAGHTAAFRRYEARPYAGRVLLVRAADRGEASLTLGWEQLVGAGLAVREAEGNHDTVLGAVAPILAEMLRGTVTR